MNIRNSWTEIFNQIHLLIKLHLDKDYTLLQADLFNENTDIDISL